MAENVVYLMRCLPACGKSYTARKLAADQGVVLETDEYFLTQVGQDPTKFDWSDALLPLAQRWNFERFQLALGQRRSPIVVNRGNGLNAATQRYARLAIEHGYRVELREPDSDWWREIRELLTDKSANQRALDQWASRLAELSRTTHRVPVTTIRSWMQAWRSDLTVEQILACEPG